MMNYDTANFINLIINTLMCVSSPLNLAVYCAMSKQFRKQFRMILSPFCASPRGGDQAGVIREEPSAAHSLRGRASISVNVAPECPYLVVYERSKPCYRRETHCVRRKETSV